MLLEAASVPRYTISYFDYLAQIAGDNTLHVKHHYNIFYYANYAN